MKLIFPVLLIAAMGLASVIYLYEKDFGRALYWFSGFLINVAVTFMMK
jgi:hypothetical protein